MTAETARTGEELFEAYGDAWKRLKSGSKVADEMRLEPGEHFEIAAWGLVGARRVVEKRRRR